jgi:putative acetyltransferase
MCDISHCLEPTGQRYPTYLAGASTVKVSIESPDAPGVLDLLTLSDEFHAALYPPESCYLLDVSELLAPGVTVVVARDDETAIGMGAIVERGDGTAEIKRMFVRAESRGTSTAGSILQFLEAVARDHSVTRIELETGPKQPAAIAFYRRNGYLSIPNFGPYIGDEFSVCFAKTL